MEKDYWHSILSYSSLVYADNVSTIQQLTQQTFNSIFDFAGLAKQLILTKKG